ncbi:MAG: hypothetical protein JSS96_11145, partial [Bacteroidetes bacterium]|nr:hypothetical protein [Bacteroidota bacterium]
MKKSILLFGVLASVCSITLSSFSGGEFAGLAGGGGNQNRTGNPTPSGYLAENDCSSGSGCHDATSGLASINFSLTDVSVTPNLLCTGLYTPGHKYLVSLKGAYATEPTPALPSFGFQCSVVGWAAGSTRFHGGPPPVKRGAPSGYAWNPFTKSAPIQVDTFLAGGAYCIENTATLTNHGSSSAPSSWEADFFWQAPDSVIADTIGFWYILCAVDGDSTSAHDVTFIGPRDGVLFTNTLITGVNKVFNNVSFSSYPNPVKEQLNVSMSNLQTG